MNIFAKHFPKLQICNLHTRRTYVDVFTTKYCFNDIDLIRFLASCDRAATTRQRPGTPSAVASRPVGSGKQICHGEAEIAHQPWGVKRAHLRSHRPRRTWTLRGGSGRIS